MSLGSIVVTTVLALCAAFAQDSGVLVPTPPRTAQDALGSKLRINLKLPPPATTAKVFHGVLPAARHPGACAIPLREVPVKENIDPGILRKVGKPIDEAMIVQPAAPECPKGSQP